MTNTIEDIVVTIANSTLEHDHKLLLQLDVCEPTENALASIAQNLADYLSDNGYGKHEIKMSDYETAHSHAFLVQGKESNFVLGQVFVTNTKEPNEQYIYLCQATNFGTNNILKKYESQLNSGSPEKISDEQQQLQA